MKRKGLLALGVSLVMLLAFGSMALASNTGKTKADIVSDLYDIGYMEVHSQKISTDTYNAPNARTFTNISSEDKIKLDNEVNQLATLSDEEYSNEISNIVKDLVVENKDRDNVYWTQEFIDHYATVYCPEYVNELNAKVLSQNNVLPSADVNSLRATGTAGDKTWEYGMDWKGINGLKYWNFTVRVNWTWDANNKITYCAPKTVGKTFMPLTYYNGIVDEYINKLENGTKYEVYKQGHFSVAVEGDGLFNKYPYIGINVYGGGYETVWYGVE